MVRCVRLELPDIGKLDQGFLSGPIISISGTRKDRLWKAGPKVRLFYRQAGPRVSLFSGPRVEVDQGFKVVVSRRENDRV